ncbi:MAG: cyclic nucleotide-binding domain-containing protein [Proteobacteria bacterium]|nr:cyclic nucleotide-binding domain-containing protein [Pseudomonadota bacterium]
MGKERVETLRKVVVDAYAKKDWPKCLKACIALNGLLPDNTGIAVKLAEVYAKLGQKAPAIETFQKVADNYSASGDFLKAVSIYKLMLKVDPELVELKDKIEALCSRDKSGVDLGSLPEIPLLSELSEAELVELVGSFDYVDFPEGHLICKEGDDGDSIFIIIKGSIKIFVQGIAGEKIEIARLEEGEFFGEVGFFAGGKRQASVIAEDEIGLIEIKKKEMDELGRRFPRVGEVLGSFCKKRVLGRLLAMSPLFGSLKESDRNELVDAFVHRQFEKGEVVIAEGDESDSLFVIKNGNVEVSTEHSGSGKVPLAELKEGDFFGEVAVVTGKPRTATVSSLSSLELMELSKKDLMSCFNKYPKVKEILERYLKSRAEKTIGTIMALKGFESKEGLV